MNPRSSTSSCATDRFASATVKSRGAQHEIRAKAMVAASGGFESNLAWLREAWGPAADNFIVRGTPYNMGRVLKLLLDRGAKAVSDPTQGHCVAIDARAPKFDGGIVTRVDAVSLGIVVNKHAQRFYDEGEDFWPKRYAIWGRLVAGQPDQIAYSIIDAKSMGKFMPPVYPPIKARSIPELARMLELDAATLAQDDRTNSTPRFGPAPSITRFWTTAARTASRRPRRTGRGRSTRRLSMPIRCARASRSRTSASPSTTRHASSAGTTSPPRTCSPPARSWRATCSARVISPASAWRSARPSGVSRARRPRAMSAA